MVKPPHHSFVYPPPSLLALSRQQRSVCLDRWLALISRHTVLLMLCRALGWGLLPVLAAVSRCPVASVSIIHMALQEVHMLLKVTSLALF